jgi:transposase-like protein
MAQRKGYGGVFKMRVVVEAIAGHKTVNEIAGAYEVHPSQAFYAPLQTGY